MTVDDGGGKTTSRFRWLYVARWAVVSLVTVVAVAVIVRAVVVMLRPEKLQMKLVGGFVRVDRIPSMPPPGNVVTLRFVLRAYNPSGRASVLYTNVTVRLIDSGSSPARPVIAEFPTFEDICVLRQVMHETRVVVELTPGDREDVPLWYVKEWFEGRTVGGARMEVGSLLTSISYLGNEAVRRAAVRTTYHCWPVTIAFGSDGNTSSSSDDYGSVDTSCYDYDVE